MEIISAIFPVLVILFIVFDKIFEAISDIKERNNSTIYDEDDGARTLQTEGNIKSESKINTDNKNKIDIQKSIEDGNIEEDNLPEITVFDQVNENQENVENINSSDLASNQEINSGQGKNTAMKKGNIKVNTDDIQDPNRLKNRLQKNRYKRNQSILDDENSHYHKRKSALDLSEMSREDIMRGFVFKEILDKPRAKNPYTPLNLRK